MNVVSFVDKWQNKEIEDWGGTTSLDYKEFQADYKKTLKYIASQAGMVLHSFSGNHYDFSAVLKDAEKESFYYISISDVRYFKMEWKYNILYRTMENDKDWTGGNNMFSDIFRLSENLKQLKERRN